MQIQMVKYEEMITTWKPNLNVQKNLMQNFKWNYENVNYCVIKILSTIIIKPLPVSIKP